jgi:hypothetical protein
MRPPPSLRPNPFAKLYGWLCRRFGQIAEPAVTFTDYALAIEGVCCAVVLGRKGRQNSALQPLGSLFFGATALAALTGGTVHGFFPQKDHPWSRKLWTTTLLALGAGSAAAWGIAAHLAYPPRQARLITILGVGGYVL